MRDDSHSFRASAHVFDRPATREPELDWSSRRIALDSGQCRPGYPRSSLSRSSREEPLKLPMEPLCGDFPAYVGAIVIATGAESQAVRASRQEIPDLTAQRITRQRRLIGLERRGKLPLQSGHESAVRKGVAIDTEAVILDCALINPVIVHAYGYPALRSDAMSNRQ